MLHSKTYIAVPPGATIKEQLQYRKMNQTEFAESMALSTKHVSNLINGKVRLTPDVAIRLENVLGIPAKFWNNLESNYREKLARVEQENKTEEEKELAKKFPYAECAKYGWVPPTRDINEKINNLRKFFRVASLDIVLKSKTPNIAYRRLNTNEKSPYTSLMWIQQAKIEAENIEVGDINVSGLKNSLNEIRRITTQDPTVSIPILKTLLNDNGIDLVILNSLKGSYMHGATFLFRKKIILAITIRGKYADKFWFSLFHEIGHIILGHIFSDEDDLNQEEEADEFARNMLIPHKDFQSFIEKNDFSTLSIRKFSEEIGIDKGILVGRLQKEGHIDFDKYNDLRIKYELIN